MQFGPLLYSYQYLMAQAAQAAGEWRDGKCENRRIMFPIVVLAGKNPSEMQRAAEARQFLMDLQGPGGGGAGGSSGNSNSRQSNWKT